MKFGLKSFPKDRYLELIDSDRCTSLTESFDCLNIRFLDIFRKHGSVRIFSKFNTC